MSSTRRAFAAAAAAACFVVAFGTTPAYAAGVHGGARIGFHHHPGWHHHGGWWGGVGVGIVLWPHEYEGVVVAPAAPVDAAAARMAPEPVVTPRNGQSATQTEADRQACDRLAMTQPEAMADAKVFHRSALACMEQRGYTVQPAR